MPASGASQKLLIKNRYYPPNLINGVLNLPIGKPIEDTRSDF